MKILITGAQGQLGSELCSQLARRGSVIGSISPDLIGADVYPVDLQDFDVSNLVSARAYIAKVLPDIIIHCAAHTNVDGCESDPDTAMRVNALGARNMAILAYEMQAKLVYVSTDYVFAGDAGNPYSEGDTCAPATEYGKSKLLGEEYVQHFCPQHFVVRTSWLYGLRGGNFVKTILRVAKEQGSVRVVNDQWGNPTNAEDLAHHILQLVATEEYGVYHVTGQGICSWYDFACEFIRLSGLECSIFPCTTAEYPRPAPRPAYSALEHRMLRITIGDNMRSWQHAIGDFMKHYDKESGLIV